MLGSHISAICVLPWLGLLQTCLITLSLCVYNAIHLNVPRHRATKRGKIIAKLEWLLIALFAPEFAVYTAWVQQRAAKVILDALRKVHGRNAPLKWYKRLLRWLSVGKSKLKKSSLMVCPVSI